LKENQKYFIKATKYAFFIRVVVEGQIAKIAISKNNLQKNRKFSSKNQISNRGTKIFF